MMNIDWMHFAPWPAVGGGLLIGLAAALLVLFNGRIAGISGIVGGLLRWPGGDASWRVAFVVGLVASPLVYGMFAALPESQVDAGWPVLLLAGVLVGVGTRYGSGCTSGHGVCGLARLSPRSMAATVMFMASGFATVYVVRHLIGG
jgi:hypothetical protein